MTSVYIRKLNGDAEFTEKARSLLTSRWSLAAFIIVTLTLMCLLAHDALVNLYERWVYEDEYGYGFLAAGLVPLLLWRRWHLVRTLANDTKWPGLALVMLAQLWGVLGALGESYFIEQIAFVMSLLGLMLVVFGTGPLRVFAPLAILLLLTIPLPYTLQAIITVKLQLLSTDIGVAAIRLMGIPVFVEGNVIDLGQYKLQVEEACSGLRYLLPLTCISFILAYLYKAPFWKRAILLGSAAPITILINSFRIAVIAALVDNFGTRMAEGFLHDFEGWVVFLVGGLLLGLVILVLERFRLANVNVGSLFGGPLVPSGVAKPISLSGSAMAATVVCVAAFGVASSIAWAHEFAPKPVRESFASFPGQIGGWSGKKAVLEPSVLKILNTTEFYIADFSDAPHAPQVNLFVAYYDSLNRGGAIHSPRVCLPGAGWEFASFEEKDFRELSPATSGTFNRVVIQKGQQRILMYYWFQQRERRTANEFGMKYYLLADGLTKSRKDGALIRVYTPIMSPGERGAAEADGRLHAFTHDVLPKMSNYLPN